MWIDGERSIARIYYDAINNHLLRGNNTIFVIFYSFLFKLSKGVLIQFQVQNQDGKKKKITVPPEKKKERIKIKKKKPIEKGKQTEKKNPEKKNQTKKKKPTEREN